MRHYLDITGKKFYKLTPIAPTDEREHSSVIWECVCDCGNTVKVSSFRLTHGYKRSCGCLSHRTPIGVGMKYGKLTVLRPTKSRNRGSVMWECLCECGNKTTASTIALNNGNKRSCGCLKGGNRRIYFSRVKFHWELTTVKALAEQTGLSKSAIYYRIKRGWTIEQLQSPRQRGRKNE